MSCVISGYNGPLSPYKQQDMGSYASTLVKTQQQKTPQMLWHATSQAGMQQGELFSACFKGETKGAREDLQCRGQPTSLIAC